MPPTLCVETKKLCGKGTPLFGGIICTIHSHSFYASNTYLYIQISLGKAMKLKLPLNRKMKSMKQKQILAVGLKLSLKIKNYMLMNP